MSGCCIFLHHEVQRTKPYIPDEATFSVKPTKTSIDNASEHTLTDYRNVEGQVLLSDEIGTTR